MFLGNGSLPEKYVGKYDCVTCGASLIPGHMPSTGFDQMLEALKIGGYIIYSVRDKYYQPLGHQAKVDQMEKDGKLKYIVCYQWVKNEKIEGEEHKAIFNPEPASVYVYQKL